MTYDPRPIDMSGVELEPELMALVEQLAARNHDIWAAQRLDEGWTFGPERKDKEKQHPDLVPYDQLPESEKEYDRLSTIGTLKAIIALGYKIEIV